MRMKKPKYNWPSYPKWVKYVAADDTLEVWGYSHKPYINEDLGCWTSGNKDTHRNIQLGHSYVPDWRASLERRPKNTSPCE